jgi:short-subunit dehydrogenase
VSRHVLITGGSSGIGAALAVAFAERGDVVGIAARRADRLAEVAERTGGPTWVADLRDPAEVDRLAATALDELGGIDVLVNNVGMPMRRHVRRLDLATVEQVLRLDFLSPVQLTLALLPHVSTVVNVSSIAAVLSSPGEAAYDAAKAALHAFGEAMAVDLWGEVHVLDVLPGLVDTELLTEPGNDALAADIEAISPEEVAAAVLTALDRGDHQVIVPAWFADVVTTKADDPAGFLAGAAAYVRERRDAASTADRSAG